MILTSVDLPAPLSPSSATTSPLPIEKLMPFSASMAPKFLGMSSSTSSGSAHAAISLPAAGRRARASAANIWPKRGDSTPDTASAAAPRSTECSPPRATMTRGARGRAARRPSWAGLAPAPPAARAAPAGARPPSTTVSGSNRFSIDGDRIAEDRRQRLRSQSASLAARAGEAHRAKDSARGSRDCRTGRARRPGTTGMWPISPALPQAPRSTRAFMHHRAAEPDAEIEVVDIRENRVPRP